MSVLLLPTPPFQSTIINFPHQYIKYLEQIPFNEKQLVQPPLFPTLLICVVFAFFERGLRVFQINFFRVKIVSFSFSIYIDYLTRDSFLITYAAIFLFFCS